MIHRISGVRVLFAGQYWPGADSLYIAKAFEKCGALIRWVNDTSLFPAWSTFAGKALRRTVRPLINTEWNRRFLAELANFQPDLVYITSANFVDPKTIDLIHQRNIPVMCFYHDPPWRNHPFNRFTESFDRFDLIATTRQWHKPEMEAAGARHVQVVRFAYDADIHRPLVIPPETHEKYRSDITFVGTNEPRRARHLTELVAHDFPYSLRIWGENWNKLPPDSPVLKYWQQRSIYEQEMPVIYTAAKIALHWVNWEPEGSDEERRKGDQHNGRTFQIPACRGAIMLAQRTQEHEQFFEEDVEAVFFDDVQELRDKLNYWLDPARDPQRLEMAQAGYERCLKEDYTFVPVVRQFLSHFGLRYE